MPDEVKPEITDNTPPATLVDPMQQVEQVVTNAATKAVIAVLTNAAKGGASIKKTSSLDFDVAQGKWRVAHRKLNEPMLFANRTEAESFRMNLVAEEIPKVEWSEDKQAFKITHPTWSTPVEAKASDEATVIVEQKLTEQGWGGDEAKTRAEELTTTARKEKIMASVEVTAAGTKQDTKKSTVSGIAPHDGAKQDMKKGDVSGVGGKVSTEEPVLQTLPDGPKNPAPLTSKHDGDYASLAKKSQQAVEALKSADGLKKEVAMCVEAHGIVATATAFKGIKAVLDSQKAAGK